MPNPVIYMDPLPKNEGVIYMEPLPAAEGIIYMTPIEPTTEGGEISRGGDLSWTLWKDSQTWYGSTASPYWNLTPGDKMWAGGLQTLPSGYKYVKIEYINDQWKHSGAGGGAYSTVLQIKSFIAAGSWNTAIEVDSTRQVRVGNYDPDSSGCSGQLHMRYWIAK